MRPIKFQAYDTEIDEMITWEEIIELDDLGHKPFVAMLSEPDKYKVRQFTGLCDRNGQEIYEGDVLVDEFGFIHVVQYFQPDCRYITVVIEAFKSGYWDDSNEHEDLVWVECKVIGNVWEHPHLLQEGDSKDE